MKHWARVNWPPPKRKSTRLCAKQEMLWYGGYIVVDKLPSKKNGNNRAGYRKEIVLPSTKTRVMYAVPGIPKKPKKKLGRNEAKTAC